MIVIGDEGGEGGKDNGIMRFRGGGDGVLSPCSISKETIEDEGERSGNVLKVLSN